MTYVFTLLAFATSGLNATAAFTRTAHELHDGPVVLVARDERAEPRVCELKGLIMHTKSNPHVNQPGHRLTMELRKARGGFYECPTTATMNVESRAEVMKLYELVKKAKKVVCQSSSIVSGAHVNINCDGSFEIRD